MNKLTDHSQERPYSEWAENETIIKSTSLGLESGGRKLDSEEILRNERKQRKHFNEWIRRYSFTVDSSKVEDAMADEVAMFPETMHKAMIDTLRERNTFERIMGKDQESILALIASYTKRPDLFLESVEEHDPGFIKRMTQKVEEFSEKARDTKFNFSKVQAYSILAISTTTPFAILYLLYLHVSGGEPKFWTIIALAALYAMSQGSKSGFISIAGEIANLFWKNK